MSVGTGSPTLPRTPAGEAPLLAVRDLSFTLGAGQTLGIVGESGSGKSVTSRAIINLLPRHGTVRTGEVFLGDRDMLGLAKRDLRHALGGDVALIPQHPKVSLNPVMTVGRQITETLRLHRGMARRPARREAADLLAAVGIPDPKRRLAEYPGQMSGGMCQRVMIAIALAGQPMLLIADEPTTALDVTIQAQILDLLKAQQAERGMAMILITHDLNVAASYTDQIAVMYAGRFVEFSSAREVFEAYRMPYTEALLDAMPRLDSPLTAHLAAIDGEPPALVGLPPGCSFAARCRYVTEHCTRETPPLQAAGTSQHLYACWNPVRSASPEPPTAVANADCRH